MSRMQGPDDELENEGGDGSDKTEPKKDDPPPQATPITPPREVRVSGEVRVNGGRSGVQVTQAGPSVVKRVGVDDPHTPPEGEPQQP